MNLLGSYSLNLSTYHSLSFVHRENTIDVVVIIVVVVLAGENYTLRFRKY